MNTNIFGNFATKFFVFVLMLIAGVATLAALATAHEVTVTVSEVKIRYEGTGPAGYSGATDVIKDEILDEADDQIWFKVTFSESVILDPGVKFATTASSGSRIPHLEIVNADGTAWTTNADAQTEFHFRTGGLTNRGTQLQIRENALYGISSNQGKIKDSSGTALPFSTSHAVVKDAGALASGTSTAPFVADSDNGQTSTPWTIPISWGSTSPTTVTVSEVKIWYEGATPAGYSGARDVIKNTILGEAGDRIWFKVTFSESVILDPGVKFATTASSGSGIPDLEIVNADGTAWTTNATAQTEFHFRTGGITSSGTHLQIRENALYGISSNQGKIKNSSGTALTLSTTDAVVQDAGALASGTSTAPFVAASDNGKTSTPWTIPISWGSTSRTTVTVSEVKIWEVATTTRGYSGARDVIKDEILEAGDEIWFKVTFSDDVILTPGVKFATTAPTGSRSPELEIVRANGAAWTTNADEQTEFHFRYTVSTTSRGTQLKIQENALYGISGNQGKIRNSSGTALTLSTPNAVVQDAGALASGTSTAPFVAASDNGQSSTPWTIPIGWDGTPSIPVTVNEVKIRDVDATTVGYSGTRDVIKNEILETGDEIWFKVTFSESVILEPGVKFSGLIRNPDDPSTVVRLALVRANGAAWTTNATAQTEFHFLHTVLPSDLYSGTRLEIWDYALHVTSNQGKIKNSSGTAFALSKPVVQDAGALASGTSTAPFVAASDDGQPSTPWTIPIRINSAPSITVTVNEVKVWEVATTTRGYSGARDVIKNERLEAGDEVWFKVTFSDSVILDPGVKFSGLITHPADGIASEVHLALVRANGAAWTTNESAQTEFHFLHTVRTGDLGDWLQFRENALRITSNQGKIKNSSGTAFALSKLVVKDAGALASGKSTAPFVPTSDNGKTFTPWTIPIGWDGTPRITVTVSEVKIWEAATTPVGYSGARDVVKDKILKAGDQIWFKVTFSDNVILDPGVKFATTASTGSGIPELEIVNADGTDWATNATAQTEFHFRTAGITNRGTQLQIRENALYGISSNQGKIKNSSGTALTLSTPNAVVQDAGAFASGTSTAPFVAASDNGQSSTPWVIPIGWGGRASRTVPSPDVQEITVTVNEVKIRELADTTLGYSGARDVIENEILKLGDEVWFKVTFSANVILDPGVKFATTASSGSRNPRLEIVKADGTPWTTNNRAQTVFHFRYTVSTDSATSLGTHLKFSNDALFAVRSNRDKIKTDAASPVPDAKILDAGALASGSTDPPFVAASDNGQGSTPWVIPIRMDGGTPAFQPTTGIARVPVDANGVPYDPDHDIVYGLASDTVVPVNQEAQGPAVAGEPFTVYIAFLFGKALHPTDVLIASDIKVMSGGKEVSNAVSNVRFYGMWGRDTTAPQAAVYLATITPPSDSNGDVVLTVPEKKVQDIAGNWNMESNTLRVPVISPATLLGVPTDFVQALPSGALASKGFVVIAHAGATVSQTGLTGNFKTLSGLPNLETLFTGNGGTLELVDRTTSATPGPIITEIMWGTDLSQTDTKSSQWIEIYNAGADIADLSKYQLKITPFSPSVFEPDNNAVDTVGNLGYGRWDVPGQGGHSQTQAASTREPAYPAVALISMRRKIDFAKATVDSGALAYVNDGTESESWEASTPPAIGIGANRIGTPGAAHVTQIASTDRTVIPYSPVVLNELGNNTGDANDWIELRNVSDAEVNLRKWELNVIVPDGDDTDSDPDEKNLVSFPDKDYKLGAGKILLIVNKDPLETPLASGKKFGDADGMTTVGAHQGQGGIMTDAMYYDAKGGLNALPESGKFLLVLRNTNNKEASHENIIDITGTFFHPDTSRATSIWPLLATPEGHGDVIDGAPPEEFKAPFVYERKKADSGFGRHAWGVRGYTGIGYDRAADDSGANGGTPGFPNDSLKEKPGALSDSDSISISEIMVVSNDGRYPQWIELRNSSATQGVNLDAWRLRIRNVGKVDSRRNVTIDLPDEHRLPPKQTMLIATRRGSAPPLLTSQRVMLLWNDGTARRALEVDNSRYTMLSTEGFTLELFGEDQQLTDTPVDEVTIGAKLLTAENIGDSQQRISLIRYYPNGIAGNWGSAKDSNQLSRIPHETYYGASDDISTPGYYPGSALPVSLSSFLPKRTDAGVVIKWTTQSELNNAGFNILRSETKTGEFAVINPTMIQGAGTTGEKHTYSYTDKTAKPNVAYYYQIEDVSFDGHRQRLTGATRLRGHVGAAGKLTTTWGGLKVQD